MIDQIKILGGRRSLASWFLATACLTSLGISTPRPAIGQAFNGRMDVAPAQLLSPPRSLRQEIRLVREALDQDRTSEAVVKLGEMLRRTPADSADAGEEELGQDYFLLPETIDPADWFAEGERPSADAMPVSTIALVRQMIGQLPAKALEIYELRYGPLATQTLADAVAARDWEAVERVRREFFHTTSGYQASALLAQREWQLGNPLAASVLLDEIVSLPRAVKQLGDEVVILHAIARHASGRDIPIPEKIPSSVAASLKVSATQVDDVRWREWVAAQCGSAAASIQPLTDYPMLGGQPPRNGLDDGQMPLSHPRWMLETSASPRQERAIDRKTNELKAGGQLPPPSWTPLRVGDQLLMRTTQRLMGVDYRTGKRVWQYPWFTPPETESPPEDGWNGMRGEEDPDAILAQRVWNDVPYGQLSSDGQRVFMIDDLGEIQVQRFGPFGMQGMQADGANNTLVALDLATQGKLLWRIGAGETEPSTLGEAFFLGPPLPYRGKLYVLVEIAGEVSLVCLRPETGTQEWRQVLLSVESGGVATDPIRRVTGALPTLHQGILICPTAAGATVAIDLVDRSLRWCNMVPRNPQFVRSVLGNSSDVSMTELGQRWSGPAAIASGRSVVLTVAESDRLIVADVLTGKNQFQPANRIHDLYVAGIRGDRYFVVEGGRMKAFSLATGTMVWATPADLVQSGQRVCGRGVFGRDSYFLPTTSDELIEVSLADGSVRGRRNVRYPLGNLIAVDGELISQSTTMLAVAYGQSSLQPRVDEILSRDPNDFTAMLRKAELLIEKESRGEAMAILQRARSLEPDNVEVQMLSVSAMLGALRDDPNAPGVDLDELEKLIDRPEQRAQLLVLRIDGLIGSQRLAKVDSEAAIESMRLLCELSSLAIEEPELNENPVNVFAQDQRPMTIDSWIAAQVQRVVSVAGDDAAKQIAKVVGDSIDAASRGDMAALGQTIRHFTALPIVDPLRVDLAQRQLRLEDPLAVERILIGDAAATDLGCQTLPTSRLRELSGLYGQTQWTADQNRITEVLKRRGESVLAPSVDADDLSIVASTPDELDPDEFERNMEAPLSSSRWQSSDAWPLHVNLSWQSTTLSRMRSNNSDRSYDAAPVLMGDHMRGWQFLRDSNSPLWLLNPYGIPRLLPIEGLSGRDASSREMVVSGGLLILMTPAELIAVDLFQLVGQMNESPIRWRRSLGPEGESIAKKTSSSSVFGDQVFRYRVNSSTANEAELRLGPILGDRLFVMQGQDLVCLDALTGSPLWRTSEFAAGGTVVAGDGKVAVVSDRQNQISIFSALDGGLIETRRQTVGSILMSCGRHVLTVSSLKLPRNLPDDQPLAELDEDESSRVATLHDPQLLELLDPISETVVLRRIASPADREDKKRTASYGQSIEGRYFVLLDTAGRATIWDVMNGRSIADTTVPVPEDLSDLAAVEIRDQMLLLPRRRPPADLATTATTTVSGGASVSQLSSIVSVSMTDGKVRWNRDFDQPWGCTTQQPWATPMLVLVRAHSYYSSPPARRREVDVMAIDVTNGNIRHEIAGKNTNSRHNSIETQAKLLPHRDEMIVEMQGETLTYKFTQEAISAEEAAKETDETEEAPYEQLLDEGQRLRLREMRRAIPVLPPAVEPPALPDRPE